MAGDNPRLAVLIDADNTPASIADALFEEVAKFGDATVRRIYGDFSGTGQKQWKAVLARHALNPVQQFAYTKGKNASDITLVIEAMDLLHGGKVEGFCLVSSDSDFTRLSSRIREEGFAVYGFGAEKTPEAFVQACSRFIYIENLAAAPEVAEGAAAPAPKARGGRRRKAAAGTAAEAGAAPAAAAAVPDVPPPTRKHPREALPLILRAMDRVDDEEEWFPITNIANVLLKLYPDFDPRTYGSARLSTLAKATGAFQYRKEGGGAVKLLK